MCEALTSKINRAVEMYGGGGPEQNICIVLQKEKRHDVTTSTVGDTPHCQVSYRQNRGTVERLLLNVW